MFDAVKAEKLIPFTSYLFDLDITIGSVSIYPLVQIPAYLIFTGLGYLSYIILKKTIKAKKDKVQLVCTLSVEENTFVVSGELLNLNDSSWLFLWNILKFRQCDFQDAMFRFCRNRLTVNAFWKHKRLFETSVVEVTT